MTDFDAARIIMVDRQVRPADVTRISVIEAMLATPREAFTPRSRRELAYVGDPLEITPGRFLMEARVFAKMLDAAEVTDQDLMLIVGAGRGYGAAVAARIAAAVVALESDEDLAARAEAALLELGVVNTVVETGPLAEGRPEAGPFDVILIEGGIEETPHALLDQLAEGGRLVAPVQTGPVGRCLLWRRTDGTISSRPLFDASMAVLPGFDAPKEFAFPAETGIGSRDERPDSAAK